MPTVRCKSELDSKGFRVGADDIEQRAEGLRRKLTRRTGAGALTGELKELKSYVAGAFTVGAITGFARSVVQAATNVKDLSEQTGLSYKQVQALDYAGKQVGMSFESLVPIIGKIQSKLGDALAGDPAALKQFKALGMDMEKLASIPVPDRVARVMEMIGAQARGAQRGTSDFAAVTELLGERAGPRLVSTLAQLGDGFDALASRAAAFGGVMDKKTIEVLDRFDKRLMALGGNAKTVAASIFGPLLEAGDTFGRTMGRSSQKWMADMAAAWKGGDLLTLRGNPAAAWVRALAGIPAAYRSIRDEKQRTDAEAAKPPPAPPEPMGPPEPAAADKKWMEDRRKMVTELRKAQGDARVTLIVDVIDDKLKELQDELKRAEQEAELKVRVESDAAALAEKAGGPVAVPVVADLTNVNALRERIKELQNRRIEVFNREEEARAADVLRLTEEIAAKREELTLPSDSRLGVTLDDEGARAQMSQLAEDISTVGDTERARELLDLYNQLNAALKARQEAEQKAVATQREQVGAERDRKMEAQKTVADLAKRAEEFKPTLDLPQVDQLARIGGQIGGAMSTNLPVVQRQMQLAEEQRKVMQENATKLGEIKEALKTMPPAIAEAITKFMGLA